MPTDRSRMSARRRIARHIAGRCGQTAEALLAYFVFFEPPSFCILDRCESHRRATEACDDDVPLLCRALRLRGVAVGCCVTSCQPLECRS